MGERHARHCPALDKINHLYGDCQTNNNSTSNTKKCIDQTGSNLSSYATLGHDFIIFFWSAGFYCFGFLPVYISRPQICNFPRLGWEISKPNTQPHSTCLSSLIGAGKKKLLEISQTERRQSRLSKEGEQTGKSTICPRTWVS